MPAYNNLKEYWEIAEARYARFASPEDEVEAAGQSDFARAGETTIVKRYNQFRNLSANRGHVK
jgi:hypothetical protein